MAAKASVEQPLWRALTGYRVLTLGWAVLVFVWEYRTYAHPLPAAGFLAGLAVWTFATLPWVSSARRCTKRFLAADIGLAVLGILISPLLDPGDLVAPTLPTIWVAGPVLAFAIKGGWRWGAGSSVLVGIANIVESQPVDRSTLHNVLLVCIAATAIGYVVEVARASERTLARALQIEAATRERERLARDIHDSVLQVLAMVQRRGAEIGGEARELGRMAGEQEVALRTLVSRDVVPAQRTAQNPRATAQSATASSAVRASAAAQHVPGPGGPGSRGIPAVPEGEGDDTAPCDVRALLSPHTGERVTFSEPGSPVLLRADAARELAAAVSAALDNVRQHAKGPDGTEATAWILLEDEPDAVLVTVRDDGPGIPEGRLADAEAEGRLGVVLSIRGRLRELGGSAAWVSVPGQGTEVELRVPKDD
jgi:signal transduction histidine kinase